MTFSVGAERDSREFEEVWWLVGFDRVSHAHGIVNCLLNFVASTPISSSPTLCFDMFLFGIDGPHIFVLLLTLLKYIMRVCSVGIVANCHFEDLNDMVL